MSFTLYGDKTVAATKIKKKRALRARVGDWHTDVWLESYGGPIGPFNSVQFRVEE